MATGTERTVWRTLAVIGIALVFILLAVMILFMNELRSLMSLKKLDDYGMYQMTYYGDYGFDEFLEVGASSDADIEKFVTRRLLKGLPFRLQFYCLSGNEYRRRLYGI